MANQILTDLGAPNVNSITDNSSVNLFSDLNGTNRMVSAAVLAAHVGHPLGAWVVRSNGFTAVANSVHWITWDAAFYDGLNFWNASSPRIIHCGFNGWVRLSGTLRTSTTNAGFQTRIRIAKNGGTGTGSANIQWQNQLINESNPEMMCLTGPIDVRSGDYFEMEFTSFGVNRTMDGSNGRMNFAISPLAVWLP